MADISKRTVGRRLKALRSLPGIWPEKDGDRLVARWETSGKKYWYALWCTPSGRYYYRGDNCGGSLGNMTKTEAVKYMSSRVAEAKQYDRINYKQVFPAVARGRK